MVFVHSCKGGIVYFVLLYLFQSKHVPSLVVPNVSAVLTDFQTIGEGLVKKIEVVNAWAAARSKYLQLTVKLQLLFTVEKDANNNSISNKAIRLF